MSEPKEYNYMIKLREFIKTGEEIQKIGFSRIPDKNNPLITERFKQYPPGSVPIMCALVGDSKKLENLIIKVFSKKFKRRRDIGKEYFEGNIDLMAIEFTKLVTNCGNSIITMTPIKDELIKDETDIENQLIKDKLNYENKPKKCKMLYCCEKCQKEFYKKSNYLTHITRKISCLKEEQDQYKILKRTCVYCVNIFSSPCAMKTHMNTCTKKPSKEDKFTQVIINLNNELKELKDILNKLNVTSVNNTLV